MSLAVIAESVDELSTLSLEKPRPDSGLGSQNSMLDRNSSSSISECSGDEEGLDDAESGTKKSRRTKKQQKSAPTDDELYDTDLEIEDEKPDYHVAGSLIYLETCRELGVVPASYFVRHINEEVIRMRHHGLGAIGAQAIAVPLVSNTSVLEMDLEDNWIEAEGAKYLAEMLKENIYICILNLAENRLGSGGAQAICDALLMNSSITDLNLTGNDFQDKDCQWFALAILENNTVQNLNLSHNELGSGPGASLLSHAVGENETIETLDISWNHFRGATGIDMVDAIKGNTRLKKVNLGWNGLGNEGALVVADCLRNNSILVDLDITSNRITVDGAAAISKGLDANETLKVFRMGHNPIGTPGALLILTAIHNERSVMEELDLSGICVCKEFISLLSEIRQSREIIVKHGQVIGDYVIKGPPPKPPADLIEAHPDMSEEALRKLENFLENDPMTRIMYHLKMRNLRLVDLFNQFDKDKSYTITIEEFRKGVKSANIGISDEQVDDLINRLDKGVKDGMIDYRELSHGTSKAQVKQRRMTRYLIDALEGRPLSGATGKGSAALDRLLPGLSRSLNNLNRSFSNLKSSSTSSLHGATKK